MKKIAILLAFIFISYCATCNASARQLPRLFIVSKGEHIAFMLPIGHIPTSVEEDGYLPEVIEKLFVRSTTLFDESVLISGVPGFAFSPCGNDGNQLPPDAKDRLQAKIDELAKYDSFRLTADSYLGMIDFAKVMVLFLGPVNPISNKPRPDWVKGKDQVTTNLLRKYGLQRIIIEGTPNLYYAYCTAGSAEKVGAIEEIINNIDNVIPFNPEMVNEQYKAAITCVAKADEQQQSCVNNIKLVEKKFLMEKRNRMLVEKIKENSEKSGVPFYAFGLSHFLPNADGPSLFTMLQNEGFSVKLIRTLDDVPAGILKRKPLKRLSPKEKREFAKKHFL